MSTDDELDQLAAEYVLGTLDASQRQAVQQRLKHDQALARAVDEWEERLLPLASLARPKTPSAGLWRRIAASTRPAAPQGHGWWHSLAFWRGLSAAGFAAAALMAALVFVRPTAQAPQYLVVLVAPQSQAPGWLVQAQARTIELLPLAPTQVPAGRTLQFWTKADDWQAPVSLGLVEPGQALRVPLDQLPPLEPNQLFELTLEPEGGSPVGRPTGPIQFIGRTVKLM
ncbi:anti-sigma factor [Bordetella petrii]|nr:anti-sigma factor [Bordetella petrii]MCD0503348.1 anti-sigma factor [Bordetella petrii]